MDKKFIFLLILGLVVVSFSFTAYSLCFGFMHEGNCYKTGNELRINNSYYYVDADGDLQNQKQDGESCQNTFECLNNLCSNGECVDLYKEVAGKRGVVENVSKQEVDIGFTGYSSIATLKDEYAIGEKIELTDPPGVDEEGDKGYSEQNDALDFGLGGNTNSVNLITEEKPEGYIVELNEKPILKQKHDEEKYISDVREKSKNPFYKYTLGIYTNLKANSKGKNLDKTLENQKDKIDQQQKKFEEKLDSQFDISFASYGAETNGFRFTKTFNGVILDIDEISAEKIKKLSEVKNVYPNLKIDANLMDSVPLIGANEAWSIQKDGVNLTGKGVNLAIVDTGIDYTHPDLGGGTVEERDFQKINQELLNLWGSDMGLSDPHTRDQQISLDSGRIVYYSKNKIFLFDFFDNTTQEIQIQSNLSVIRLALKDSFIGFFADEIGPEGYAVRTNIYLYDLILGKLRQVDSSFEDVGFLDISNNNLIYGVSDDGSVEIRMHNIVSEKTETIWNLPKTTASISFQVSGTKIAYSIAAPYCYDKIEIYDFLTKEKIEIAPPSVGNVLDFKDNKVIYLACNASNFDRELSTYYLYDFNTGEAMLLKPSDEDLQVQGIVGWINKAFIGDNGIFFVREGISADTIVVYDLNAQKYSQINLVTKSGYFSGEGDKICFISNKRNVYCHDYNLENDYHIPQFNFGNRVLGGWDFVNNDSDPIDDMGHGTHVAGIAAGNGALKGVAPDAKLYAYKVLNSAGRGSFGSVISAIEMAVDPNNDGNFSDHLDIMSMSFGAQGYYSCSDDELGSVINNALDEGVSIVIAAGNDGPNPGTVTYPSCFKRAISVGSTTKYSSDNLVSSFSSRGLAEYNSQLILKPDLVAPGERICSAQFGSAWNNNKCFDDNHVAISGTSMATPHVAGAIALIKQAYPNLNPEQIKNLLMNYANQDFYPEWQQYSHLDIGAGMINVSNALRGISENGVIVNPGSISFGFVDMSNDYWEKTERITIDYFGQSSKNVLVLVEGNLSAEVQFTYPLEVLISSNKVEFDFKIKVDRRIAEGYYEGNLVFELDNRKIKVPFFFKKSRINIQLNREIINAYASFESKSEVPLNEISVSINGPNGKEDVKYGTNDDQSIIFGEYYPKKEGDYSLVIQGKDGAGSLLTGEKSFIFDSIKPELNLTLDKLNKKLFVDSSEDLARGFSNPEKLNREFILYPSFKINKEQTYMGYVQRDISSTFYWGDILYNKKVGSAEKDSLVVNSVDALNALREEDQTRNWGSSASILENSILVTSDNEIYGLFKLETNNGFCGVDRIGLRKFDNIKKAWVVVNDNILNVDHCTDDKIMCASPSSYRSQWCEPENNKFDKAIYNPIFIENNNSFYIFWTEPAGLKKFNFEGYIYQEWGYSRYFGEEINFFKYNSFYKQIDRYGETIIEKIPLGDIGEYSSNLIDDILISGSKAYLFLDTFSLLFNYSGLNMGEAETSHDVNYKIFDFETNSLSELYNLETDGYDFSTGVDRGGNIHAVFTNSTVYKGAAKSRYGQLYYGTLNLSEGEINVLREVKPSGSVNREHKISVNGLGDILILFHYYESGLKLNYWLFDHKKSEWETGRFGEVGFTPEIKDILVDEMQSFYALYFGDPQTGWHYSGLNAYLKSYYNPVFAKIRNRTSEEFINLDGLDRNWEGSYKQAGDVYAWGRDSAGNIGFKSTERPQSKIVNNANKDATGNLIMKIQKNVDGEWQDYQEVYNSEITVPANGLIKLDVGDSAQGFVGFNDLNVVVNDAGDYRVYAKFENKTSSFTFKVK